MNSTRALKATGLVLIAVVLALFTVQGSYALWNKAVSSNAGTVQAADFRISLTDTITSQVTDMTLANGTAATLSLSTTPAGLIIPGQSTYAGVQVGNVTNAGGDFTVRASTSTPIINNNAGSPLAPYLVVKAVAATSLSQCSQASLYAAATPSGTSSMDIAKAGTGVFCFQISLSADMPASLAGQTATIAIPITATQL
ncbi:hypothetical protein [Arthrobacter sp. TWP1-1]|uniref:hypothetical protein n=1 Tax=Arthrobacter sp. TWP1-1 TaxID=2804568 RepID=UPI003CEA9B66